jgi:hypothetical protein
MGSKSPRALLRAYDRADSAECLADPLAQASRVGHNQAMEDSLTLGLVGAVVLEDPFTLVLVGAVVLFALIGVGSFLVGGSAYDKIGEGGLSVGDGSPSAPSEPPPGSPQAQAEREQEIRQMLQARSERLVRGGGQALDIDAELARLAQPAPAAGKHDATLALEVRQLVVARNERRVRAGEEPLDVETEVQRTLDELDPDGQ